MVELFLACESAVERQVALESRRLRVRTRRLIEHLGECSRGFGKEIMAVNKILFLLRNRGLRRRHKRYSWKIVFPKSGKPTSFGTMVWILEKIAVTEKLINMGRSEVQY